MRTICQVKRTNMKKPNIKNMISWMKKTSFKVSIWLCLKNRTNNCLNVSLSFKPNSSRKPSSLNFMKRFNPTEILINLSISQ